MSTTWETVIGLEIHTQLSTQSKIFSGASTAYGAEPNTQACAVDLGLPGVLPVLNEAAVEKAVMFGLAIEAEIAPRSVFARKNYFYPDLPKGYQISQMDLPIVGNGHMDIEVDGETKRIGITRAHLEEDAGKSLHESFHGMSGIDLNRAGTPLLEIVSEPDMRSAQDAIAYAKKIHELVQWLDICDGNMQEGSFRCDVNVSVRPRGVEKLGTRREIKNLNSFRYMQQAIEFETNWQIEMLQAEKEIKQATVLFDPDTGETRAMRSKEEANDYRYFPDPDLLPLSIDDLFVDQIRSNMPEMPEKMRNRFVEYYFLDPYVAAYLTSSRAIASFFETMQKVVSTNLDINKARKVFIPNDEASLSADYIQNEVTQIQTKLVANWIMVELSARLNRDNLSIDMSPITPEKLAGLILEIAHGNISGKIAKQVFEELWQTPDSTADSIIEAKGLKQITDTGAIEAVIDQIITANGKQVEQYRGGNDKVFGFFVGQVMKAMQGKANPAEVNKMLMAKLKG
ncbi:MAG: Asp-tRNA(Asn)/Glu-tRNA(Gln) amidotransferase subunit GatB [Methylovulum miyakonense]|uniref:Asp-tRNA(Asn)/Glu-tRNA(Gln) amidotransferase subunit GatB n=1 Tax=Methylovulum miyakonense TaxID=645578 RepID=UPI003BB68A2B